MKNNPKKLKVDEIFNAYNKRLNGCFYDNPISFLLKENPEDGKALNLKNCSNGFLYIDEVDKFSLVSNEKKAELKNLADLFKLGLAISLYIEEELNTKDFPYVAHNERGYPCAEYRGGVFEVSIRTDISPNCYEASVGAEILRFASLEDAVASFVECIKDSLKWRG
ncbi:hypothetical protein ABKV47_21680 [Enterobacter hormaechei]